MRRRATWLWTPDLQLIHQSERSSTSFSVTVITPVAPSISTRPKNCSPKHGARFSPCSGYCFVNRRRAERVLELPGSRCPRAAGRRRIPRTARNPEIPRGSGRNNARQYSACPRSAIRVLLTPARLMNDSRSAISCSRRSRRAVAAARSASLADQWPIGRSAAITFQVAFEAASSRFSQASCAGPRIKASSVDRRAMFQVESR